MRMTESLFDNIINTAQDCVFWKDKNRRFVGVNQAFLDFYGFESADILIGKTDEDMGWHSDPGPFMEDELRVLEGHSTYKVQGKCMIRGEERDIIASKRPIYDGEEIVGLVGSFVDVTDVLSRSTGYEAAQYTAQQLRRYPFFDRLLDDLSLGEILDPLTGVVSRGYFYSFVKSLTDAGTPFSFMILDLDNFKYINDTYGHLSGDHVLQTVTRDLAQVLGEHGLVGRFGGDELLMVDFRDLEYADKRRFLEELYTDRQILRRNLTNEGNEFFVTGTIGCASFPADAKDYDEIFLCADRTLYHGKSIGRNCYTIYVREKHEKLKVQKLAKRGVYTNMNRFDALIESQEGFENRLGAVVGVLRTDLHLTDLYYAGAGGRMRSLMDPMLDEDVSDLALVTEEELYAASNLDGIREKCPRTYETFQKRHVGSVLAVRIGLNGETDGFLICAEPHSQRIWQEDECGILYFIAKNLAAHLRLNHEKMPD